MVRAQRSRRFPASILAEVDGRHGRDVPRPARDRDLQLVVGARQLQHPPARAGRIRQARRAAGGRLPGRVPRHVARRVPDEADDDAVPQPDGDGRRGVHPRVSARRRGVAHRLRQDEPREHSRRGEREHPGDRGHRRPDAERPLARPRAWLVQRLLALPRGAASGAHHRGGVRGDRERDVALERALHDDGHRVDDGVRDRGARAHAPGRRRRAGRRLAPTAAGRDGGPADRRPGRARSQALGHPHRGGVRECDPSPACDLGLDERSPASDRLRRPRRGRPAVAAVRRPLRNHAVARRPQAGGAVPDGGLLLRRRPACGAGADLGPAPPRCRHRDGTDDGREHRRRPDRERGGDQAGRRSARPRRRARRPHRAASAPTAP